MDPTNGLRQAESGAVETVDTFSFLLGTWCLERSIEDHLSGTRGAFRGRAALVEVAPDQEFLVDGRASYDERGELRWGSHVGPASRRLGYTRQTNAAVLLSFADGRPFVNLDLGSGVWQSTHDCGADRYEIATVIRSYRVLQETWRVRGPGKAYDAITTLTRLE